MLNRTPARMGGPSAADPCGYVELLCFLSTVSHSRTWPWPMVTSGGRGCFPNARECELGRRLGNGESTLPSGTECLHHERPKSQFGGECGKDRGGVGLARHSPSTKRAHCPLFFRPLARSRLPSHGCKIPTRIPIAIHQLMPPLPGPRRALSLPFLLLIPKTSLLLWQQPLGTRPTFPFSSCTLRFNEVSLF